MKIFKASWFRVGVAFGCVLSLTAAINPSPTADQDLSRQRFFEWEPELESDGRNHFIIELTPSVSNAVVTEYDLGDGHPSISFADETLARIVSLDGMESVKPIGFDLYALTTTVTVAQLEALSGVEKVTEDLALAAASVDEYFPLQWPLENTGSAVAGLSTTADADVNATEAWHRNRGAGVVVAVIDTGVDVEHPDLAPNIWTNPAETCGNQIDDDHNGYVDDCQGWDFVNDDATVEDLIGHGTHIAGTIAAVADNEIGIAGLAYEAKVMALKVGDEAPVLSAAIEAFAYAIDNGARIINASWVSDNPAAADLLRPVLEAAGEAGVLVVTGAGNDGVDIDANPVYPASLDALNLIVVGASTATDVAAGFSNYGVESVDLFAPGEHVISTLPGGGYGAYSGTSMAAPHVAAAAALLWAASPEASMSEVRDALLDRAERIGAFKDKAATGARLDIGASINTRLFSPALAFSFSDFNNFEPDQPHSVGVTAKAFDPWIAAPQLMVQYRLTLLAPGPEGVMAVAELPFTFGSGKQAVTDQYGSAMLGNPFKRVSHPALVQDGDDLDLSLTLPTGTYALVMELVDVTDPAAPLTLGDPAAVFFGVGLDGLAQPAPEINLAEDIGTSQPTPETTVPEENTVPEETTTVPSEGDAAVPNDIGSGETTTSTIAAPENSDGVEPATTTTTTTPAASETESAPGATTSTTLSNPTSTTAPTTTTSVPSTATSAPSSNPASTTTTTVAEAEPTADEPAPADVVDARFEIVKINPVEGPIVGGTMVTIIGRLPEQASVRFGEAPAKIVTADDGFIVVQTSAAPAGVVDVVVKDSTSGEEYVLTSGFEYIDEDAPDAAPPADPGSNTSPSTTVGPSDAGEVPAVTTTTTTVLSQASLKDWMAGRLVTPQGLVLAPLPPGRFNGLNLSLVAGSQCNKPVCPGWIIDPAVHRPGGPAEKP